MLTLSKLLKSSNEKVKKKRRIEFYPFSLRTP